MGRLLGEKTRAAYNPASLTRPKAKKCIEWAQKLVDVAEDKASAQIQQD